jgi:hypothetical protein
VVVVVGGDWGACEADGSDGVGAPPPVVVIDVGVLLLSLNLGLVVEVVGIVVIEGAEELGPA